VGQDITQINAMTAEQQRVVDDLWRVIDSTTAPICSIDTTELKQVMAEAKRVADDLTRLYTYIYIYIIYTSYIYIYT